VRQGGGGDPQSSGQGERQGSSGQGEVSLAAPCLWVASGRTGAAAHAGRDMAGA
jgi:hypothetical protein